MNLPKLASAPLPKINGALHWVDTLDGGAKIRMKVCSPSIWGLNTHYNGRTKPCFEDHSLCENGHDDSTVRWYGYVFGIVLGKNRPTFLQLTPAACRQWFEQIAKGVSLRGMTIDVSRTASKKGRINVHVAQYMMAGRDELPADCDPVASLFRLWKVKHLGHVLNLSLATSTADIPDDEV